MRDSKNINNTARRLSARFGLLIILFGLLSGCATHVPPPPQPEAAEPPPVDYVPTPAAPPAPVVEIQATTDFYAPLTPYGRWVAVAPYGQVWCPAGVVPGWRPYCVGHWVWTDAGWYWVSDEPWGWATYHYGRWMLDPVMGWYWVPHTRWAPAWAAWRQGGGYCGWAPLGVSARFEAGGSFSVGVIAPGAFVFVGERDFCNPIRPNIVIVNRPEVINRTVEITKFQVVNKTVVNVGPRPQSIASATGRQIHPMPVNQLRHQQETAVLAKQPQLKSLQHVPQGRPSPELEERKDKDHPKQPDAEHKPGHKKKKKPGEDEK